MRACESFPSVSKRVVQQAIKAAVLLFSPVLALAAGPYYPVYNTPPANSPTQAPEPAQPPPAVYYGPYYAPPYYGPIRTHPFYPGPLDPALGPWKFNFDFGGGPTAVAHSQGMLRGGGNFIVGGGYNFSPHVGLTLEFMQSDLGITDKALNLNNANDGRASIWSVTLNPVWRYKIGGIVGGYIIGGGGFYEREEKFSQTGIATDFFGNQFPVSVISRQYDDTGGLNIGTGLTFNVGWGTKFFVEARYHYLFTSGGGTQIVPVTFGFRW